MRENNNSAMVGYPVYLLVAIIASTLIIGIFSFSMINIINQTKKDNILREIEKIISEAENMFEYADAGSEITIDVDFSDMLKFIVFGSLPINGTQYPNNYTIDEKTSNNYYYVLDDGELYSFSSHVRFSSNETNKISVFSSGSYDLVLDLEKIGGHSYVKIYSK